MNNIPCLILSHNELELTRQCIESVLDFFAANRIHLVHNGSDYENVDILKRVFPDIHHFVLREHKGYTGGANFGLLSLPVDTNAVLFLTNDCELVDLREIPKQDGIYAPLIQRVWPEQNESIGGELQIATGTLRYLKSKDEWNSGKNIFIPGNAFLLVGSALKNREPFDERLGSSWEDVDFSMKMTAKGVPLLPADTIRVRYGFDICEKKSAHSSYQFQRNRRIVSRRYVSEDFWTQIRLEWSLLKDLVHIFIQAIFRRDAEHIHYTGKILRDSF